MYKEIFENLENGILNNSEIVTLLKADNADELFKKADEVRERYIGSDVYLRGIIEFSNYCKRQCLYCGIQVQNDKIRRYRIEPDEIIAIAKESLLFDYKTVVLQSGEDNHYTDDMICHIVREIKKMGFAITLSIGEKTYEQFKKYKEAGADRYLLKHETSDLELYKALNPKMSFEDRIECHRNLKKLGYEVGSGIMVGLPNQTLESVANDIIFFKKMDYDMIGISPFIPHQDTELKDGEIISLDFVKRVVAITRIVMKNTNLPVTTAFSTLNNSSGREEMLNVGANVIMPNITPIKYKMKYELYPNKACLTETAFQCRGCLEGRVGSVDRKIVKSFGFRKPIE